MRPLATHTDHLCWQQRVSKERTATKDFYRQYFPIRKPLSLSSKEPFVSPLEVAKCKLDSHGGTILGKRYREVRGKYSRSVDTANGLIRLKGQDETGDLRQQLRGKSVDLRTTGRESAEALARNAASRPASQQRARPSTAKPQSTGVSPKKFSREYIQELQSLLKAEQTVPSTQRRKQVESRISLLQSRG